MSIDKRLRDFIDVLGTGTKSDVQRWNEGAEFRGGLRKFGAKTIKDFNKEYAKDVEPYVKKHEAAEAKLAKMKKDWGSWSNYTEDQKREYRAVAKDRSAARQFIDKRKVRRDENISKSSGITRRQIAQSKRQESEGDNKSNLIRRRAEKISRDPANKVDTSQWDEQDWKEEYRRRKAKGLTQLSEKEFIKTGKKGFVENTERLAIGPGKEDPYKLPNLKIPEGTDLSKVKLRKHSEVPIDQKRPRIDPTGINENFGRDVRNKALEATDLDALEAEGTPKEAINDDGRGKPETGLRHISDIEQKERHDALLKGLNTMLGVQDALGSITQALSLIHI